MQKRIADIIKPYSPTFEQERRAWEGVGLPFASAHRVKMEADADLAEIQRQAEKRTFGKRKTI